MLPTALGATLLYRTGRPRIPTKRATCRPLYVQVVLEVLDSNVKRGCAVYETGQARFL